ncbi:unnamed protein product [Scytosiphon promiscuus]
MGSISSWAVIVGMALLTLTCAAMYCRLLRLRHSFDIVARSPALLVFAGLSSLFMANTILLHRLVLQEGRDLPCYMMFWSSYTWFALSCTPFCLRAVRLVVVYHTVYRLRYARFVKRQTLIKAWALITIAVLVYAAIVFVKMQHRYASGSYGCFFFNEKLMLEVGLACCVFPVVLIVYKLASINDTFGIKPEIVCVLVGSLTGGVLQVLLLELVAADVIPPSHVVHLLSDMIVLIVMVNVLYWSAVFPLALHYRFGKKRVVPSVASTGGYHSESTSSRENPDTCLRLAREGGEIAHLFGEYCRRSLCMESWDFILESVSYEDLTQLDHQLAVLATIVNRYLKPTSPQEVNISSAMRDSVGRLSTTTNRFSALSENERRTILWPPLHEICRMLDDNLLKRFAASPVVQQMLEQQKQEELDLKHAEAALEGDTHMLELMRFASFRSVTPPT